MVTVAEAVAPLRRDLDRAGIFCDFDGTLSPIVEDPAAATFMDGAADALAAVAQKAALVAVVSGRPLAYLAPLIPANVVLSGLYGLELLMNGTRSVHPSAGVWREVVVDVAEISNALGPEGMLVEPKELSLTLHYRSHPDLAPAVRAWADRQAARSGLRVRPARMSVELHPPIHSDKGTVIRQLVHDADPVCFLGDDQGDLSAFRQLDGLADEGRTVLRVAVSSNETPSELADRADLVLPGPPAAVEFLRALAAD